VLASGRSSDLWSSALNSRIRFIAGVELSPTAVMRCLGMDRKLQTYTFRPARSVTRRSRDRHHRPKLAAGDPAPSSYPQRRWTAYPHFLNAAWSPSSSRPLDTFAQASPGLAPTLPFA